MTENSAESVPEQPAEPTQSEKQDQPNEPTWEDDETSATLFLRAGATLLVGAMLAWAQCSAVGTPSIPSIGTSWTGWIQLSVVANFLLPLGVVWMFFGQGLLHQDWLKDQRHNAWNYGWNFKNWRRHFLQALIVVLVMLPGIYIYSHKAGPRDFYQNYYFPPMTQPHAMWYLLGTLIVYMFCWEWFFRGFLLFGMAQGFGLIPAWFLQTAMFGLTHAGKDPGEFYLAFVGGGLLGVWAWRERSFLPAFFTHALLQIAWAILIYH